MSDSGRTARCNMCELCHGNTYEEIVKCRKRLYDALKWIRCELSIIKRSKVPLSQLVENGRIIESAAEMYHLLKDYQTIGYAEWCKRRFTLLKAIEGDTSRNLPDRQAGNP